MRENRTCGSEGGEAQSLPYPYQSGGPTNAKYARQIKALPIKLINRQSPRVVSRLSAPRRAAPPGRAYSNKPMLAMHKPTKIKNAAVCQVQAIQVSIAF